MTGAPRGPLRASTAKRRGSSFEALLGEDVEWSAPFGVERIELDAVAEEQIDRRAPRTLVDRRSIRPNLPGCRRTLAPTMLG
jgi:hypothetical protein